MKPVRKVDSIAVFAPVREGHVEPLKAHLSALPDGDDSPLKRLPGTHMARLGVVPYLKRKDGSPLDDTSYLLFSADFDAPADAYIDALVALGHFREIFAHCAGVPEDADPESLRRFLSDYRLKPGYSVVAYPEADLDEVLSGLKLRRQLAEFVLKTRGQDAATLKREWLATFGTRS